MRFMDHGRCAVVRLTGEIDLSNAEAIRRAIGRAIPNHALRLILDLNKVDFLDSAGIQLMYHLRQDLRARGQTLQLAIASMMRFVNHLRCTMNTAQMRNSDWRPNRERARAPSS